MGLVNCADFLRQQTAAPRLGDTESWLLHEIIQFKVFNIHLQQKVNKYPINDTIV